VLRRWPPLSAEPLSTESVPGWRQKALLLAQGVFALHFLSLDLRCAFLYLCSLFLVSLSALHIPHVFSQDICKPCSLVMHLCAFSGSMLIEHSSVRSPLRPIVKNLLLIHSVPILPLALPKIPHLEAATTCLLTATDSQLAKFMFVLLIRLGTWTQNL